MVCSPQQVNTDMVCSQQEFTLFKINMIKIKNKVLKLVADQGAGCVSPQDVCGLLPGRGESEPRHRHLWLSKAASRSQTSTYILLQPA